MKEIIMCMFIDPYFAILTIGQIISYVGMIFGSLLLCKRILCQK